MPIKSHSFAESDQGSVRSARLEKSIANVQELEGWSKLIGSSPAFLASMELLPKLARSAATVLITGETGTGKELVARAIHYQGCRAGFPFVAVNCGSLPDSLLEDELFGHERGAYTDARNRRVGLIAHADRGTLFLDEVDSLSAKGQAAILRVLQDKRFRAVGANEEQESDVRIVAATNVCLETRIKAREFRADLFYRLGILTVHLPALRDRKGDVLLLVNHFLEKHAPANRKISFSSAARERLTSWHWPGNLRELENVVIRACALCEEGEISSAALGLPEQVDQAEPVEAGSAGGSSAIEFSIAKRRMIQAFERDYLTRLMRDHCGNISQAAQTAGKERRDLGKLLKKHQLDPTGFRSHAPSGLAG